VQLEHHDKDVLLCEIQTRFTSAIHDFQESMPRERPIERSSPLPGPHELPFAYILKQQMHALSPPGIRL
jgi:hypothetical protein